MGGIETQVSGLVEYQKSLGHDVFVLTLTPGDDLAGVVRFPFHIPGDLLWHPKGKSLSARSLLELKADVVHLHFGAASPFAWDGMKAVVDLGIPSVATVHSIWGSVARRLYSITSRKWKSKTVFSSVSAVSSAIVSQSLNREVAIAHNGVDINFWRGEPEAESKRIEIVSATRFASRKRIRQQISVIESVVKELGDNSPHFTIAGTGPDFRHIQKLVEVKKLQDFITLTGRLDKVQLRDLYLKSDLFLQMSILEAFGIAACEARASGLPVLTRKGSGVSEFVESASTGYLEESDSQIVKRILGLVANRDLIRELKINSKTNPPIQTWQHAEKQVATLYQQAINQG